VDAVAAADDARGEVGSEQGASAARSAVWIDANKELHAAAGTKIDECSAWPDGLRLLMQKQALEMCLGTIEVGVTEERCEARTKSNGWFVSVKI
jgi:hypothetical protein